METKILVDCYLQAKREAEDAMTQSTFKFSHPLLVNKRKARETELLEGAGLISPDSDHDNSSSPTARWTKDQCDSKFEDIKTRFRV